MTVTEQVADTSPDDAVIVAVPYPAEVTKPVLSTVATDVSEEDQDTVPPAGTVVAVNC